jgi:DNA polymerase-1
VVKTAFVPRDGCVFSFFDYQQIEPRILAYFASLKGDKDLAQRMIDGLDPYTAILVSVYGDKITPEQRQEGKIMFLSLMYGGGVRTIQEQFGVDQAKAKAMVSKFHRGLPIVRTLQDGVARTASSRGFVRTPWGRHLHPEAYGEHKLLNKLIQGSAAHLMKRALLLCEVWAEAEEIESKMLSVVHDEIVWEGPPQELARLNEMVPFLMAKAGDPIQSVVPIGVDHEVGVYNMAEKQTYGNHIPF